MRARSVRLVAVAWLSRAQDRDDFLEAHAADRHTLNAEAPITAPLTSKAPRRSDGLVTINCLAEGDSFFERLGVGFCILGATDRSRRALNLRCRRHVEVDEQQCEPGITP